MARVTGACPHFFTVVATSVCVCFLKEQGHPNVQPLFLFVCFNYWSRMKQEWPAKTGTGQGCPCLCYQQFSSTMSAFSSVLLSLASWKFWSEKTKKKNIQHFNWTWQAKLVQILIHPLKWNSKRCTVTPVFYFPHLNK